YTLETAECIKYANNSFLATKISFINEFANICERVKGVDITNIAKAIGLDFRINPRFLQAGAGFGGSCFPKDVKAMIKFAKEHSYEPKLLESVMSVNEHQAKRMIELAENLTGSLEGKKIAILGLSFKPDTDDMRSAPSLTIIRDLLQKGALVVAWDPQAINEARKEHWLGEKIIYANTLQNALKDADVCMLVTDWDEFKKLSPENFLIMKTPILIDGRRIYDYNKFIQAGIKYAGIGLGI
ncbi:MAG: nucleotide sugar dehydrogenase, partial [Candidatus Thorarchaeota archaeon]